MRLSLLLLAGLLFSDPIPSKIVLRTVASVVRLDSEFGMLHNGSCSAFSINGKKGLFLTASHCVGDVTRITGDSEPVKVLLRQPLFDLAVFSAPWQSRTALKPMLNTSEEDAPVAMIGYGHGWSMPLTVQGRFKGLSEVGWFTPLAAFEPGCFGGQSGGPIVNVEGRVLALVQLRLLSGKACFGLPMPVIWSLTGEYWEYRPE